MELVWSYEVLGLLFDCAVGGCRNQLRTDRGVDDVEERAADSLVVGIVGNIGSEVTLEKNQILVKLKINGTMTALKDSDFEIVGYSKNIKKGTAKVTIRGKYPYGGTKTVNFKIIARPLQKK